MKKRVFIALRMAGVAGQSKLAGIFRYFSERCGESMPWDVELVRTRFDLTEECIDAALARGVDGFIVSIPDTEASLGRLAEMNVPTVLADVALGDFARRSGALTVIRNSAREIGREAAEYFMGQGVARAYAFLHAEGRPAWSVARFEAYREALADNGFWCTEADRPSDVAKLGRRTAVFAANDDTAFRLVEALTARRMKIPADFAVLGVDNDILICENVRPRLSSIQPDFEAEGFMAAEALDAMMRSASPLPVRTLLAGVKTIVRRESTVEVSHAGRLVQRAVAYIDAHATEGIRVGDVVDHLGCSRRLADLRFRQLQGCSILEAIINRRLDAVRRRIMTTRDSLDAIAADCGFGNSNYLKNLFKKRYSMTMSEFRRSLPS